MKTSSRFAPAAMLLGLALLLGACAQKAAESGPAAMSFFVTSSNPGKGADFGGLAGADRYCQQLATAVGAGRRDWHAYLSSSAMAGSPAVNARDRIGRGPWRNARGTVIANNVEELHQSNMLTKQSALTEKGEVINGRGDPVNTHDILTGSQADGRAFPGDQDMTCGNWTKGGDGVAMVGHHDRIGLRDDAESKSWNASNPTKGCGMDALKSTGGGGLLYCFAAN
jgi:hypothetical protein